MLKHFMKLIPALMLIVAANTHALPIIETDAFIVGDNQAFHQMSSNLDWLDFNTINNKDLNQVVSELNTTYLGWRLPMESEVKNLFGELFLWGSNTFTHLNTVEFHVHDSNPYPQIIELFNVINTTAPIHPSFGSYGGNISNTSLIQMEILKEQSLFTIQFFILLIMMLPAT